MQELTKERLQALINHYSSVPAAASALGVTPPTVYSWLNNKKAIRPRNSATINRLWEQIQTERAGQSREEKNAIKRGLFLLRVSHGKAKKQEAVLVVCEYNQDPPHGALVVCDGVLGRWSVAINSDLNLITSVTDGSILQIDSPPDHVVLGRLMAFNGNGEAAA